MLGDSCVKIFAVRRCGCCRRAVLAASLVMMMMMMMPLIDAQYEEDFNAIELPTG